MNTPTVNEPHERPPHGAVIVVSRARPYGPLCYVFGDTDLWYGPDGRQVDPLADLLLHVVYRERHRASRAELALNASETARCRAESSCALYTMRLNACGAAAASVTPGELQNIVDAAGMQYGSHVFTRIEGVMRALFDARAEFDKERNRTDCFAIAARRVAAIPLSKVSVPDEQSALLLLARELSDHDDRRAAEARERAPDAGKPPPCPDCGGSGLREKYSGGGVDDPRVIGLAVTRVPCGCRLPQPPW